MHYPELMNFDRWQGKKSEQRHNVSRSFNETSGQKALAEIT